MTERVFITDEILATFDPPPFGERRIWDTSVLGFVVRIYPTGRRVFGIKHKVDGRQHWTTIGTAEESWDAESARARAVWIRQQSQKGRSKAKLGSWNDRPLPPSPSAYTVADVISHYFEEGRRERFDKRERSWFSQEENMRRHVVPRIGHVKLRDVQRHHIVGVIRDTMDGKRVAGAGHGISTNKLWGGPGIARLVYANTKTIFNWAMDKGFIETNPATRIALPRRPAIGRRITVQEVKSILAALDQLRATRKISINVAAAIKILIFTGARNHEIRGLRWSEVRYDQRALVLPPARSKTGNRTGERRIALPQVAADLLKTLPREGPFVFAGRNAQDCISALYPYWRQVLDTAGVSYIRIHDLRHTFASVASDIGQPVPTISAALGHSSIVTTQIYLHQKKDAVIDLSEKVAMAFLEA